MPAPTVATKIHQTLDIHRHLAPTIPLDHITIFNYGSNTVYIISTQIIAIHLVRQIRLIKNLTSRS